MSGGTIFHAVPFDSLIFDLDGTLWDTSDACATAWNNVLKKLDIVYRPITAEDVRRVTGKPHEECIRATFTDLGESQVRAISQETMLEDNRVIEQVGGILYEGVSEGLLSLRENARLFIVSNCQSGYIETFLDKTGLHSVFEDYECWGNTGKSKGQNLRSVIERNSLKSPLMIGDAEGDEIAARDCGVPFAYMSYGFGTCIKPDLVFSSFHEFLKWKSTT